MEWPFRRFVKAFDAYQRRSICDEWRDRKSTHIAALFANSNLDDEKNDRPSVVKKLEEAYDHIVAQIWNGGEDEKLAEADEEMWNSPLMQAGRRAIGAVKPPILPGEHAIGALPA